MVRPLRDPPIRASAQFLDSRCSLCWSNDYYFAYSGGPGGLVCACVGPASDVTIGLQITKSYETSSTLF